MCKQSVKVKEIALKNAVVPTVGRLLQPVLNLEPCLKELSILIKIKWALEENASTPARIVFSLFSVILPITLLAVAFSTALKWCLN